VTPAGGKEEKRRKKGESRWQALRRLSPAVLDEAGSLKRRVRRMREKGEKKKGGGAIIPVPFTILNPGYPRAIVAIGKKETQEDEPSLSLLQLKSV